MDLIINSIHFPDMSESILKYIDLRHFDNKFILKHVI